MTRENEEEGERKKEVKRKRRRKRGFIYLHKNWTVTDIWWEQGIVQLSLNNWLRCVLWKKHALFPFEEAGGKKINAPTTSPPVNNTKVQIRRMIFHLEKLAKSLKTKQMTKKERKKSENPILIILWCCSSCIIQHKGDKFTFGILCILGSTQACVRHAAWQSLQASLRKKFAVKVPVSLHNIHFELDGYTDMRKIKLLWWDSLKSPQTLCDTKKEKRRRYKSKKAGTTTTTHTQSKGLQDLTNTMLASTEVWFQTTD